MYKGYRYIDADAHVLEPSDLWQKYLEPEYHAWMPQHSTQYVGDPPAWDLEIRVLGSVMPNFPAGKGMAVPGIREAYGDYIARGFDASCYRDVLERTGMDYMVVYPTAGLYCTAAPGLTPEIAAAYRRAYNNWLSDLVRDTGPGLIGAGSIDLRDPVEAAREVRRCVRELGLGAITFNPEPVTPVPLHDPFFDPIWKAASELGVAVGVHVAGGTALHQVGTEYFHQWSIGRPLCAFTIGNMIACLSFVAGGVLERFPDLRVVFLESGAGWVAFWLERIKAGVAGAMRKSDGLGLRLSPIEYFQRQCFISADPDDPGIELVKQTLGDDCIVTATDFGHVEGKGYVDALDDILALPNLGEETRRKIMWDNPARLYGLR
jgi:predicted TIM-barrel fold metal-dependent hydrolase